MNKVFNIDDLRKNSELFDEVKVLLGFERFRGVYTVDELINRFHELNTCCETYVFVNDRWDNSNEADKELHSLNKDSDEAEAIGFVQIDLGTRGTRKARIYGTQTYYEWDEENKEYQICSFGNEERIEIEE